MNPLPLKISKYYLFVVALLITFVTQVARLEMSGSCFARAHDLHTKADVSYVLRSLPDYCIDFITVSDYSSVQIPLKTIFDSFFKDTLFQFTLGEFLIYTNNLVKQCRAAFCEYQNHVHFFFTYLKHPLSSVDDLTQIG